MAVEFIIGQHFGQLTLRGRVRENPKHSATVRKRWRCECSCGKMLTVPEYYLVRKPSPKTSCGCLRKTSKTIYNQEYRIWLMMLRRTTDETHVSWKHYGGRGIKVCGEWSDPVSGFDTFLAFVGPRPSPEHTIDRINNDQGYQPYYNGARQVRWATADAQAANKGRASNVEARG